MSARTGREIHLASRPQGWPTLDNFRTVEVQVAEPGPGQVLIRNLFMSVDPYMRGRMNDTRSYIPPFALDAPLAGGAIGEVIATDSPDLRPGDIVLHSLGWREWALAPASAVTRVDPTVAASPSAYLGALGMTGLTAYVGLLDVAAMRPGDTVFISGAAGAVGSLVGQIARQRGAARVIGSAGSAEKVDYLTSVLGFDAAFNYKDAPVSAQLRDAAPQGVDVYFDNVGADHLEAAIDALRVAGRIALCGAISQYNTDEPGPGIRNLTLAIGKRLTIRGFIVSDHNDQMPRFLAEMSGWLADGRVRAEETIVEGIERAAGAFVGMLRGENTGKMLVRLG